MRTKIKKTDSAPRKPLSAPNYTVINAALEERLDLAWTEVNQKAIQHEVGTGDFFQIQEIISFVSNQDAWLNDYSISSAADKVSGKLSQHYPLLSSLAVFKLINHATYGWH